MDTEKEIDQILKEDHLADMREAAEVEELVEEFVSLPGDEYESISEAGAWGRTTVFNKSAWMRWWNRVKRTP